jgi:hypothetical protein
VSLYLEAFSVFRKSLSNLQSPEGIVSVLQSQSLLEHKDPSLLLNRLSRAHLILYLGTSERLQFPPVARLSEGTSRRSPVGDCRKRPFSRSPFFFSLDSIFLFVFLLLTRDANRLTLPSPQYFLPLNRLLAPFWRRVVSPFVCTPTD